MAGSPTSSVTGWFPTAKDTLDDILVSSAFGQNQIHQIQINPVVIWIR